MVAHARAGGELHFAFLHVETGVREEVVIAGVIVVHMRRDNMLDIGTLDAHGLKRHIHRGDQLAPTACAGGGIETAVDHNSACLVSDHPDVIINGHG